MRRRIEFDLPDGSTIIAEVDDPTVSGPGPRPAGAGEGAVERAAVGMREALARVRPFAELVLNELGKMGRAPEQISLEFGIKLNVSTGVLIANTAAEGNCKITVNWKNPGTSST